MESVVSFFKNEVVRSVLLTFLVTFVPLVLVPDFTWTGAAVWAAVATGIRTALSAGLPGGSYGRHVAVGNDE